MSIVQKILIFTGVFAIVTLTAMASVYGWGAPHPVQQRKAEMEDDDIDRHHTIYHGGHFRPFYGSWGGRSGRAGSGGFRGGK